MEFVPVDASAEDGFAHGFVIVGAVVGAGLGVLAVLFEDEGWIALQSPIAPHMESGNEASLNSGRSSNRTSL